MCGTPSTHYPGLQVKIMISWPQTQQDGIQEVWTWKVSKLDGWYHIIVSYHQATTCFYRNWKQARHSRISSGRIHLGGNRIIVFNLCWGRMFGQHLNFWGRLYFLGCLHLWGCLHFWGRLYFLVSSSFLRLSSSSFLRSYLFLRSSSFLRSS